jgi:site-specific recombinase XerD
MSDSFPADGDGVRFDPLVNGPAPQQRPGPGNGGTSSDATPTLSPENLAFAARILEAAMKNKTYRSTPLGQLVGRYIRWCRNERGLVDGTTIRDYEYTLARMALTLPDLEPCEVTIEHLRTVIDLWADREPRTRKKVTSAIRSFWKWAEEEGHVEHSPASRLRTPKIPKRAPELLPIAIDSQLLAVTETVRDRLALLTLLDLGLRKSELVGIQVADFDLGRLQLTVHGKGQKERVLPLRGRIVLTCEEYLLTPMRRIDRPPEPDDFLLYSEWRKHGNVYRVNPKKPMPRQSAHRWWYEHLQRAGLVAKDVQRGMNMHRARHTFATELRRDTDDLGVVQHMLGHADIHTTEAFYGHYDLTDLERAMEKFARGRRDA